MLLLLGGRWLCCFCNCCLFHPVGSRANKGAARKRPSEADLSSGAVREKKKRKQKPRLPKNFDPENPGPKPDPERWLPKWQRSDFKKKRNRRREKASSMLESFLMVCLGMTIFGCKFTVQIMLFKQCTSCTKTFIAIYRRQLHAWPTELVNGECHVKGACTVSSRLSMNSVCEYRGPCVGRTATQGDDSV